MRRESLLGIWVAIACAVLLAGGVWIVLSSPEDTAGTPRAGTIFVPDASGLPADVVPSGESGGGEARPATIRPEEDVREEPQAERRSLPAAQGDIFGTVRSPKGAAPEGLHVWVIGVDELDAETLRLVWANKRSVAYFVKHRVAADLDETGSYMVGKVKPGTYLVVAWAPGFARAHGVVEHDAEPARCDLQMEPGEILTGVVENSAGDPIPGATVEAQRDYHTGSGVDNSESAAEIFAMTSYREVTLCDAGGRFQLDTLEKGQYLIWGQARDYSEEGIGRVFIPPTKELSIRLFEGGAVEGIVRTPAGTPIPDVLLWCGLYDRSGAILPVSWSGPDGRFRFDHVAVGPVSIITAKPPYAAKRVDPGYLERGTTMHAVVELEEGVHIRGQALDEEDRGVSGLRVAAVTLDRKVFIRVVRTDETGAFDLIGVPRGVDRFLIYTWGAPEKGFLDTRTYAGSGARDVLLRMRPYGTLVGKVIDGGTGEPVTAYRIRAAWEGEKGDIDPLSIQGSPVQDVASTSGTFRLEGLIPGVLRVFVTAPGYARHEQGGVVVPDGGESEPLLVALEPGGVLEGRVVSDRSGAPIAGAHIVVLESVEEEATGVPGLIEAKSDDRGAYRLSGLGVGRPSLQVHHPDYPDTIVEGPRIDKPGELETLEIRLGEGGTIDGLAYDAEGHPDRIASVRAWLMDTWGEAQHETFIDEEGRFRLQDLSAGLWTVEVGKPETGPWRRRAAQVRTGQTAKVVFDQRLRGGVEGEVFLRGEPVQWAWVWLDDLDPRRQGTADSDYGFTTTDEEGRFAIDSIEDGAYELSVRIEGADSSATRRVQVPRDGSAKVHIDLGSATVSGTVVDPITGAGVAHARVRLYGASDGATFSLSVVSRGSAATDASGSFAIENVAAGSYELVAVASGHGASARKELDVPEVGVQGLVVALSRESFLRVAVADEQGAAVPSAGVYVHDAATGRLLARDLTVRDGTVEFGKLPVGEKVVVVAKEGFALGEPLRVETRPEAQQRVATELPDPHEAWVQVMREDGTVLPAVPIALTRDGISVRHLVFRGNWVRDEVPWVTDGEGRCHLAPLGAGRYEARIEVDGKEIEKAITIRGGDAPAQATFLVPMDS